MPRLSKSIIVMAVLLVMPVCALAATGGPDGGGYTYDDGALYIFDDIADVSNSLDMPGDDRAKLVPMGFDFRFYGSIYNSVYVSSNGHLDFREGWGNANYNYAELAIPQYSSLVSSPDNGWGVNPLIAPFFDDLDPVTAGEVYVAVKGSYPNRTFIVQWDGIPHFDCSQPLDTANNITVQAILYETYNQIKFQYKDVTTSDSTAACQNITGGGSAVVGLDFDHRVGLEYPSVLLNGLAIIFAPPATAPLISPSAEYMDFGDVMIGNTPAGLIKLSNLGDSLLLIEDTTPPLSAPFSIVSDNCSGRSVPSGDYCTLSVLFEPSSAGAFSNSLIINSNSSNPQMSMIINGTAVLSLPSVGDIAVSDLDSPFNDLQADLGINTIFNSAETSFTVNNEGTAPLLINAVEPPEAPFALTYDNCSSATLSAGGGTCDFGVRFVTSTAGEYHSTFNIISEDPDESPLALFLNATALYASVANISVSDSDLPSDDNRITFTSTIASGVVNATVTVGSNGTADLDISSISLLANSPYEGSYTLISNSCDTAVPLAVGNTCQMVIGFTPVDNVSNITGTLSIISNDPDESPYVVSLAGSSLYTPPSAPELVYPEKDATGVPAKIEFKWNRSVDPDPGDVVTYRLYYTTDTDYLANGFDNTIPQGPFAKAGAPGSASYAAALTAPGFLLMAAMAFFGPVSRRRKTLAALSIILVMVLVLAACGSGLPDAQAGYEATLSSNTKYHWKVVATDSHGLSTESAVWSFTTAP